MKGINSNLSSDLKNFLKLHIKDMKDLKDFKQTEVSSLTQTYYGWDYILFKEHFSDDKFVLYANLISSDDIDLNVLKTHIKIIKQFDSHHYNRKLKEHYKTLKVAEIMLDKLIEGSILSEHELYRLNMQEFNNETCNNLTFYKAFICAFGKDIFYERILKNGPRLYMQSTVYSKLAFTDHVHKRYDDLTHLNFAVKDKNLGVKLRFQSDHWMLDPTVDHTNVPKGLKVGECYFYEEHNKVNLALEYLQAYIEPTDKISAA
jgi:hypothetical protein